MIKKLSIVQYRKLKDIEFNFVHGVNFISGTNGTCKSSLLHIISNSFQAVVCSKANLTDKKCMGIIRAVNASYNPKIETLTRGDKQYNDPAKGRTGSLFTVEYINGNKLEFRRHNSSIADRYAIKPKYSRGTTDKLPELPVLYLGLSRLYPIGEFQNDDALEKIHYKLPDSYRQDLKHLYNDLTHIEIENLQPQRMKGVKVRNDFTTQHNGIDGNTISSGEDNVFIILTALFSLKYYFECLPQSTRDVESMLLIDEFDATLHPSLQERLLDLIREFSMKYKIQFMSTTHSLSLLEYCLRKKDNVIYICDNIESVTVMSEPDIFKIKMRLKTMSRENIYADKKIPIFTEDAEARLFLTYYMDYLETHDEKFKLVRSCFHFVDASIGSDCLRDIFKDLSLSSIMNAICILDGDKTDLINDSKSLNIIVLPGKDSPEKIIFKYAEKLFSDNDDFWTLREVEYGGYDRVFYRDTIQPKYQSIIKENNNKREKEENCKGELRRNLKRLWNDNQTFVSLLIKHWINNPANAAILSAFTAQLNIMFMKTAEYHGINKRDWIIQRETHNA